MWHKKDDASNILRKFPSLLHTLNFTVLFAESIGNTFFFHLQIFHIPSHSALPPPTSIHQIWQFLMNLNTFYVK